MEQRLIRYMTAIGFSILSICTEMKAIDIIKDGKAAATIVLPVFTDKQRETDERWTKIAANWFVDYLKRSTGADIKIVREGTPVEGNIISIGHTKMAEDAGIKIENRSDESKIIKFWRGY